MAFVDLRLRRAFSPSSGGFMVLFAPSGSSGCGSA
jgi:hypothetical protein